MRKFFSKPLYLMALIIALPAYSMAMQEFPKLCDVQNFDDYLAQTGKSYPDEKERQFRESIFMAKKSLTDLTNKNAAAGHGSFKMNINALADRTVAEVSKLLGSKITFKGEDTAARHTNYVSAKLNTNLPNSFDWRTLGGVTPAGYQGIVCGSCWTFSTVGALEGHLFRRTGILVPLSEQNLLDCAESFGNMGCDGGFQEYAFEYIRENGISLDKKYPYIQMEDVQCHRNETGKGVQIRDYARIKPGDEEKMKEVIATLGPIACSINAMPISFQMYISGIYDDDECNQGDLNHSVTVVGYGTEGGVDYWIIKNSYSENWGENGFMKMIRNKGSFCGIADECSFPIL